MSLPGETTLDPNDRWSEAQFEAENIHYYAGREMLRTVQGTEGLESPKQFAIVTVDGKDPASVLGRDVEKTVFWNYFQNDLKCLRKEYTQYDDDSVFIVAIDTANLVPAGAIRIVKPRPGQQVKSVADITSPELPWNLGIEELKAKAIGGDLDLDKTIDVATLAIKEEYRPKGQGNLDKLSAHLYYAMYQWSRANGFDNWIGVIDTKPVKKIQELGSPLDFFPGVEAAPYIDSGSSIPFYANLDRIDERIIPIGLDTFFKYGQGLDEDIAFDIR